MPLYEVVLEQEFNGVQSINRWNYMGSGTPAAVTPSFALAKALGFAATSATLEAGTVGAALQGLQNLIVNFVQASVKAVYGDTDFYDAPFFTATHGIVGDGGTAISPVNAFGFRTNRVRQSIGRGYKRFVGVDESIIAGAGEITAPGLTAANAVAAAMSATLTYDDEGNNLTFIPVVVSKEKYTTPSGKEAYKYYPTELLQAPHVASGVLWTPYTVTRSQVSRQYGRGS